MEGVRDSFGLVTGIPCSPFDLVNDPMVSAVTTSVTSANRPLENAYYPPISYMGESTPMSLSRPTYATPLIPSGVLPPSQPIASYYPMTSPASPDMPSGDSQRVGLGAPRAPGAVSPTLPTYQTSSISPEPISEDRNSKIKDWIGQAHQLGYVNPVDIQWYVAGQQKREDTLIQQKFELELAKLRCSTVTPASSPVTPILQPVKLKFHKWNLESGESYEVFFHRFERFATECKWDERMKLLQLIEALPEKAATIYRRLDQSHDATYDSLKIALERQFALNEEQLAAKFRKERWQADETVTQFVARAKETLAQWFGKAKRQPTFENLFDFVARNQIMGSLPTELKAHLLLNDIRNTDKIAEVSENWVLAHGHPRQKPHSSNATWPTPTQTVDTTNKQKKYQFRCNACKTNEHFYKQCPKSAAAAMCNGGEGLEGSTGSLSKDKLEEEWRSR